MRLFSFLSSMVLCSLLLAAGPSEAAHREVRVGIAVRPSLELSASSGKLSVLHQGRAVLSEREVSLSLAGGRVSVGGRALGDSVKVMPPRGGLIVYGGRSYRGHFEVLAGEKGLVLVNVVPLEDYVKGVLKMEVNPSWPMEVLKAQAVVARTYALANLGRHRKDGFDLCASVHCQEYRGASAEDERLNRAVEATSGEVLTYGGALARVFYHSDSGGYTSSAKSIWGEDVPYLRGVKEEFYHRVRSPHSSWRLEISAAEVGEALSGAGYDVGLPHSVEVTKRDEWGFRAVRVAVSGSRGRVEMPASRFRQILGYSVLKSTAFEVRGVGSPSGSREPPSEVSPPSSRPVRGRVNVRELMEAGLSYDEIVEKLYEAYGILQGDLAPPEEPKGERAQRKTPQRGRSFVFEGRGWGHGVGMSQWGARALAEMGKSYRDILGFYFPGTAVSRR